MHYQLAISTEFAKLNHQIKNLSWPKFPAIIYIYRINYICLLSYYPIANQGIHHSIAERTAVEADLPQPVPPILIEGSRLDIPGPQQRASNSDIKARTLVYFDVTA